ncbi:MAG: 26S protease regulatory subunit, partial [Deltaproteobacteria bacterium]|nr:26S protease regulatory subunit [Deltaproteobacteria bacterium]
VAATNRADLVDPALKRGGRLDRVIEIPLPDANGRRALFGLYLKRLNLSEQIDVERLVAATSGKSGADIRAICNQAGLNAFKRESKKGSRDFVVKPADIDAAVIEICGG